jgi:hypothetical protein
MPKWVLMPETPHRMPLARRLVAAVTAIMPPSRRDWGRAMSAELDFARSRTDRAQLVLGAVRLALLPPGFLNGLRDHARTAVTSVVVAAIAYLPLGAGLYESNVVNRSGQDTTVGLLTMDAYQLVIFITAGVLARRASPRISTAITAGVVAGAILGALETATFAWIDNSFFSIISQQQEKIDSFRGSGMTSMHAYLNASIESSVTGVILSLAITGAVLALIGAALWTHSTQADLDVRSLQRPPERAGPGKRI